MTLGYQIGYARVSTREQSLDMQLEALKSAGCEPIFTDTVSGVSRKRPGRDAALRQVREGDTLVVWKLDRVSRSLLDLLTLLQRLDADGVKFKSLTETFDTSGPMGRAVVGILGAVAQLERDLIRERTRAGIDRAIANGVKFGQPTIFTEANQAKIAKWLREGLSVAQIAQQLDCHPGTIRRVYTAPVLQALRERKKAPPLQLHSRHKRRR